MEVIKNHLPSNCYSRHLLRLIDGIIIHFISAKYILPDDPFNLEAILEIFKKYKVSAKYLIRRDGTLIELTPGNHRQYHAGYSRMNGRDGCNNFTIGVELEGGLGFPYTREQIPTLVDLIVQVMSENNFPIDRVRGHSEVRSAWMKRYPAKSIEKKVARKVDPGDHFPMQRVKELVAERLAAIEVTNV